MTRLSLNVAVASATVANRHGCILFAVVIIMSRGRSIYECRLRENRVAARTHRRSHYDRSDIIIDSLVDYAGETDGRTVISRDAEETKNRRGKCAIEKACGVTERHDRSLKADVR